MKIEVVPFQFISTNTWQNLNKTLNQTAKHIQIQKGNETVIINNDTIAFMYIECKIVSLMNFSGNNFILTESLNYYEELLEDSFFRVNRQYIINRNNIKNIISSKGKVLVELLIPKDKLITVTCNKEREFYKWIKNTPISLEQL
ncbi:MAG: LytTR family transcriptional regulator DNA-binding domain-containing protein [Marinifilaceae bacterium]|nr:LytTR family transcriptional regulator DNA-binding domain-containing protein [Marinifilaceae bacterium]